MHEPAPAPLTAGELLDRYFLENRARLLEIAAFLDRLDRSGDPAAARQDFRYRALLHGIERLRQAAGNRARDVQIIFSDPTSEPLASADDRQSAAGAWPGIVR
jgi:hypothetical protein